MKTPDSRALMLALRAWMEDDESGRNAERVVKYIYEKALSGHFGFFKLAIDLVDGKLHQTAEEEPTVEADCVLVVAAEALDIEQAHDMAEAP
jgi:hypothetical protein